MPLKFSSYTNPPHSPTICLPLKIKHKSIVGEKYQSGKGHTDKRGKREPYFSDMKELYREARRKKYEIK